MSFHQEIPAVSDRLSPIVGRLRLISQYIEQPGVTEFDVSAELLWDCANQLEDLTSEIGRANAQIHRQYGCCGRVEVVFHAN